MPESPNAAIAFSNLGGTSTVKLDAFETSHVAFRIRDTTDAKAEATAMSLHSLFSASPSSVQMGATWVVAVDAPNGSPSYVATDVKRRAMYLGTYILTTAIPPGFIAP
jgi:hypothetical protein